MTTLYHWMLTPTAAAVSWTLIHFLWQGAAIALALAISLALLRDARSRYAAACAALTAMLAAPIATLCWLWPSSALRLTHAAQYAVRTPRALAASASAVPSLSGPWYAWLVPLWFAGVLAMCLWRAAAWFAARRLRTSGVCPADLRWEVRLRDLARELGLARPVRLFESCLAEVPLAVGFLRPVILLPIGLATGLRPDQVEAILLHELAHIRRCDYLVNLLQTAIEGLLFYHPAVWWVSGIIRAERENCCDDLVVRRRGDASAYAATLATLEIARCRAPRTALAAAGGRVIDRVRRLTRQAPPNPSAVPLLSAIAALATLAMAVALWYPRPAAAQEPAPQQAAAAPVDRWHADVYQKWLDQDVVYIITDEEREAFQALTTDAEREHFIEQFWQRRDPTPGTLVNEFKQEHYRRIAYANQHFNSDPTTPGWRTDQGRIYITYGPPDELENHPNDTPPSQQWLYHHIEDIGDNVIVLFIADSQGRFHQDVSPASGNVFISTGRGQRVIVEVQPDRTARISISLGAQTAPYMIYGELANLSSPGVTTRFQQAFVATPEFRKDIVLEPGEYRLSVLLRNGRGEGSRSQVTFKIP